MVYDLMFQVMKTRFAKFFFMFLTKLTNFAFQDAFTKTDF